MKEYKSENVGVRFIEPIRQSENVGGGKQKIDNYFKNYSLRKISCEIFDNIFRNKRRVL